MAAAALIGSLLLLLLARNVITHPPEYDELLHVLAARGIVETGEPVIADGRYDRAELFTRVVAASFQWRGESLESARLPALVGALALVVLLAIWVTSRAGFIAGASAAALLAMSVTTVGLATFARFYTLHALAVAMMSISLYEATALNRSWSARISLVAVVLLAAAVALHLQITTIIAIGAALCGIAATLLVDQRQRVVDYIRARPVLFSMMLVVAVAFVVILEWQVGLISHATEAPLWAKDRANRPLYYVQQLATDLPLFWPLFPVAALAATTVFGRFGVFCVAVAVAALAAHSIAAAKAARYVYYALPFVCAVMGCGVAVGVRLLRRWVIDTAPKLTTNALTISLAVFAVVLVLSQEGQRTLKLIAGKTAAQSLTMYASESDWSLAMPALRAAADAADIVIVSAGVKGLYYLGRYDFELNATAVVESESGEEFGTDLRTGRKAIGTPASLADVLARAGNKLIVVDQDKLGRETGVAPAVVKMIQTQCKSLAVPSESRVFAWSCGLA